MRVQTEAEEMATETHRAVCNLADESRDYRAQAEARGKIIDQLTAELADLKEELLEREAMHDRTSADREACSARSDYWMLRFESLKHKRSQGFGP